MMNYLKNQGTWKLSQLKNLSFVEVKEEFDKLLQTKTSKRLKSDETKDDKPTKQTGKRRKQMARKGLHTDLDKNDSKDSDEASEQDDSASGTKIPINPVPVAMKSIVLATYKDTKQGERGVYQIIKEDGTDIVYINFRAMLKDISRDDLTELYRIVYGLILIENSRRKPDEDCYKTIENGWKKHGWIYPHMSNRHKDWLVQEQTALGNDFSNPLMDEIAQNCMVINSPYFLISKESG
ncbi:hypothetical protein Tco_1006314 [Tanacetum coccineum]|uniref:Uncharacterized protein n=1 Tax=Tanacetum coccineum TaxID=301880 RepID=A0ABQ5FH87_9ASTR